MKSYDKKLTCFVFGEGRKDRNFIMTLIDNKKFQYHTKNWTFNYDNASGGSPYTIAAQCKKASEQGEYDLILCLLDLDKLKQDFSKKWETEKKKIEEIYPEVNFLWQKDNAEDEYKKVLGKTQLGKHQLNQRARSQIDKFVNSDFWKRLLKLIKNREGELGSN